MVFLFLNFFIFLAVPNYSTHGPVFHNAVQAIRQLRRTYKIKMISVTSFLTWAESFLRLRLLFFYSFIGCWLQQVSQAHVLQELLDIYHSTVLFHGSLDI